MSLGGGGGPADALKKDMFSSLSDMMVSPDEVQAPVSLSASSKDIIAATIEKLRSQISAEVSDDDEVDVEGSLELLKKNKAGCTPSELEKIRRERNRLHARNTRQRKKKMLFEMESVRVATLTVLLRTCCQASLTLTPTPLPPTNSHTILDCQVPRGGDLSAAEVTRRSGPREAAASGECVSEASQGQTNQRQRQQQHHQQQRQ